MTAAVAWFLTVLLIVMDNPAPAVAGAVSTVTTRSGLAITIGAEAALLFSLPSAGTSLSMSAMAPRK